MGIYRSNLFTLLWAETLPKNAGEEACPHSQLIQHSLGRQEKLQIVNTNSTSYFLEQTEIILPGQECLDKKTLIIKFFNFAS